MNRPIIIVLDDSSIVCALVQQSIESIFAAKIYTFTTEEEISDDLISKADILVVDYFLGNHYQTTFNNGLSFMKRVKKINQLVKVIAFSGQKKISLAVDFLNSGATDYIDKNQDDFLDKLQRSIMSIYTFDKSSDEASFLKRSIKLDNRQFLILLIVSLTIFAFSFGLE